MELKMLHKNFEKEMMKRSFDLPRYDIEQTSCGKNGWAFELKKDNKWCMEWLVWTNGKVSCLRIRHKDSSQGQRFDKIKKCFDFFEKL